MWIAVAAVGAVLWGCGGDSSSDTAASAGSTAPTNREDGAVNGSSKTGAGEPEGSPSGQAGGSSAKAEFVDQANAICKAGKKKGLQEMTAYAQAHASSASSTEAKVALLGEAIRVAFLPEVQNQVDEIRALDAPPGDEKQVAAFLDAMEEGVEASRESSTGLRLSQHFKRSANLAHEYGLDSCAYGTA